MKHGGYVMNGHSSLQKEKIENKIEERERARKQMDDVGLIISPNSFQLIGSLWKSTPTHLFKNFLSFKTQRFFFLFMFLFPRVTGPLWSN
jgi:hypothetical protein